MSEIAPFLPLIFTLALVGAVAGFSAGLFGIGGGAVMVPALFFAFDALGTPEHIVMHSAVATSSAVIIVNAMRSTHSHHKHGAVDWSLLWPRNPFLSYALWIGLGSFIAALWIAPRLSGQALSILFAIIAVFVALQFIFGRPDLKLRDNIPDGIARPVVGGSVGVISSLMGIGGGSLTVPLMSLCGVPIHRAVATASGFGFAIALPATIGFVISGWSVDGRQPFSLGYVNALGFAIIGFLTVPLGTKAAHSMDQKNLKRIFGVCLFLVAVNMVRKVMA